MQHARSHICVNIDRGSVRGMIAATIGATVRQLRVERGLTQEQLARRIGVGLLTVGKWERDDTIPSPENHIALAKALGVEPVEVGYVAPSEYSPEPPEWFKQFQEQQATFQADIRRQLNTIERKLK